MAIWPHHLCKVKTVGRSARMCDLASGVLAVALLASQGRICTEGVTAFEAGIFEDHDKQTPETVLVLSPKLKVDFACSVAGVSPPAAAGCQEDRMKVRRDWQFVDRPVSQDAGFLTGQLSII